MSRATARRPGPRPGSGPSIWTPARLAGLAAFRATGTARESNVTGVDVHRCSTVYWQVRRWLEERGLVVCVDKSRGWYRLTPAGVDEMHRLTYTQSSFDEIQAS